MDDPTRAVLARLDRIERLRLGGAAPTALLAELRELVREGEAWAARAPDAPGRARAAVEALRRALDERDEARRGGSGP